MVKSTSPKDEGELLEPRPRDRVPRPHRLVRDEEGHLWRIRELTFADAPPSLVFESEGVFRRVRHYPTNWEELTDVQLYALSWKT